MINPELNLTQIPEYSIHIEPVNRNELYARVGKREVTALFHAEGELGLLLLSPAREAIFEIGQSLHDL